MKLVDLIKQITEAVDPEEEIDALGEKQDPKPEDGPEDAQSSSVEDNTAQLQSDIEQWRGIVEEQEKHIEQLTAQIAVFIKQGAVITNETDAEVKKELAAGNTDLEERAKKLEQARKGIYSLNLGKDKD